MAGVGQLKRGTTTQWSASNPILAIGEIGVDLTLNIFKIGDGTTHWVSLPLANQGATGSIGPTGPAGTGLSRVTTSTIDFGIENNYIEETITDAAILSTSTIIIQITGEDFIVQNCSAGMVSISNGVSYTIYGFAPDGASGIMNINILIF